MLTDLSIRNQPLPEKRKEVPDGKIQGLYLVLQPSGAKSWAVRYRADGSPRKLTIGPYPAVDLATARDGRRRRLASSRAGKILPPERRPPERLARAEHTTKRTRRGCRRGFRRALRERKVGRSWAREMERLFRVEILPQDRRKAYRRRHAARHPRPARRHCRPGLADYRESLFAVLRKFFNWAADAVSSWSRLQGEGAGGGTGARPRADATTKFAWHGARSMRRLALRPDRASCCF